ncbi:MAG: TetR/AcrR family transcriptional regulator [Myxococcales bacterium]|nr:TetR/AcrR family transcriptional regulator [Myxococcales bacterium]
MTDKPLPEPKQRVRNRREATRASLKEAAVESFARWGFTFTTVDEIAKAAGVSNATFYKHFESKEDIFAELDQDYNDDVLVLVKEVFENTHGASIPERLRAIAERIVDGFAEQPTRAKALLTGPRPLLEFEPGRDVANPELRDLLAKKLIDFFEIDIDAAWRIEATVAALLGAWVQVIFYYLARASRPDADVLRGRLIDYLVNITIAMIPGEMTSKAPLS